MRVFLAGVVIGGLLGGLVGGAGTVYILAKHQHFASRIEGLFGGGGNSYAIAPGSLGDVVVEVDATSAGRPISKYIYGVASADGQTLIALGATVDRWGGNPSSSYNWVNGHSWNAGRDWGFRNVNYGNPGGRVADGFIAEAIAAGAVPLITIPSIGYVAKNDQNETQSVDVPAQGGPPLFPGSQAIAGYDPSRNQRLTSVPSFAVKSGPFDTNPSSGAAAVYQDEWVHEMVSRFGAAPHGVGYFAIDNEPDLWSEEHTDVHPTRLGYADMLAMYEQYAKAVKAQDPTALLLGPDVSGWTGYFYSALDRGTDNFATHADRNAHGGTPFLPWWLGQVAQQDRQRGARSLDLVDVHYYPQAQGVFSDASDAATQALRIRSVRSLWDPNYVDESWISDRVQLIPRLQQWIAQEYPGTGVAISEYNFGGEKDASGAVALAEALGIFGREGVRLATYWTHPDPITPAGAAFRMYRNYDGHGGTFGDISLPGRSSANGLTVFAAKHSGGSETDVMLINESPDQVAKVHLDLGLSSKLTVTQYLVQQGSAAIVATPLDGLSAPVQVPPYSVSLVKVVAG